MTDLDNELWKKLTNLCPELDKRKIAMVQALLAHTLQTYRDGSLERFINNFNVLDNGCWQWNKNLKTGGYGQFCIGNTTWLAHRYSYSVFRGDIPNGLHIDHLCRNRGCVNPAHLEVVTNKTNVLRGEGLSANYARRTHCDSGHEFSTENTYITHRGGRECRTCRKAYNRAYGRGGKELAIWGNESTYINSVSERRRI